MPGGMIPIGTLAHSTKAYKRPSVELMTRSGAISITLLRNLFATAVPKARFRNDSHTHQVLCKAAQ